MGSPAPLRGDLLRDLDPLGTTAAAGLDSLCILGQSSFRIVLKPKRGKFLCGWHSPVRPTWQAKRASSTHP